MIHSEIEFNLDGTQLEKNRPEESPVTENIASSEYTCPMHPEVRQIGPGTCPKCGMALEPMIALTEEE